MQPQAFEPDRSSLPRENRDAASNYGRQASGLAALQAVVVESVARMDGQDRLALPSIAPFIAVAQRHAGAAFCAQSVGRDLVEAALLAFFGRRDPRMSEAWRTLADPVSVSVSNNPIARTNMERLWTRLQAAAGETGREASGR
jgi:hypothetical protein